MPSWQILAAILSLLHLCSAATVDQWRSRSIYQVITDRFAHSDGTPAHHISPCAVNDGYYCGGTWRGIMARLDYIQGMGFDAIWISPVVAQVPQRTGDGESYTAYWQQDLYALNDKFGTQEDLKALVDELHRRDMYLMLDIVVNHMGYAGVGWVVDYSIFNPFNDQKYFHDYCTISDPTNQNETEMCWLGDWMVSLADLRTEDEEVQEMFATWIESMVSNYSIDGLRIDTSLNVNPDFFTGFVKAAGVFATGEVMQGDTSIACRWSDTIGSILNYPIYYPLTRAFQSSEGSINDLVETIQSVKDHCGDPTVLGSFSENHDVPRFRNYTNDLALAKNIITYTIMADGIPIIYQGQEQRMNGDITPYFNRAPLWEGNGFDTESPLYGHIRTLNNFRQHAIRTSKNYTLYMTEVIFQDMHSLALRKGFDGSQVITVLNNNGRTADYFELPITNHGFDSGTKLTEILTCAELTVNASGYINVPMFAGTPKILYPSSLLTNTSLCGTPSADEPTLTSITSSVTATLHGYPTVMPTVQVTPVPVPTHGGGPPPFIPHPQGPAGNNCTDSNCHGHDHKRPLGDSDAVGPPIPFAVSAAMLATAVSALPTHVARHLTRAARGLMQ